MGVITISREYGCPGELVAERVSKVLSYKYINKELIEYISILTGVPKGVVEQYDEEKHSSFKAMISKYFDLNMFRDIFDDVKDAEKEAKLLKEDFPREYYSTALAIDGETYQMMVERVIRKLADEDNVVILGRGGQCILQDRKNALHIRLYATFDDRVKWVSKKDDVDEDEAAKRIREVDKRKKKYIEHYYKKDIDDKNLYHLFINLSKINVERAVGLIVNYMKK